VCVGGGGGSLGGGQLTSYKTSRTLPCFRGLVVSILALQKAGPCRGSDVVLARMREDAGYPNREMERINTMFVFLRSLNSVIEKRWKGV